MFLSWVQAALKLRILLPQPPKEDCSHAPATAIFFTKLNTLLPPQLCFTLLETTLISSSSVPQARPQPQHTWTKSKHLYLGDLLRSFLRYLRHPWLPQVGASALLLERDLPWAAKQQFQGRSHHCFLWALQGIGKGFMSHALSCFHLQVYQLSFFSPLSGSSQTAAPNTNSRTRRPCSCTPPREDY